MMDQDILKQIINNAQKVVDDCEYTAESNFALGKRWDNLNLSLGLVAAFLSASAAIFVNTTTKATGEISLASATALLAALSASVLTFLKPSERATIYREFGNKYRALRNRSRVFISIDCLVIGDYEKLRSGLDALLKEKEDLNLDNPVISTWAFRAAKKSLDEKNKRKSGAAPKQ